MQSRVRICLQTTDTVGHPEPLGTASTDPSFQHTDVHAPRDTIRILPRMDCSYFCPVKGNTASVLRRPQQDKPAIDAPTAEDVFQVASG